MGLCGEERDLHTWEERPQGQSRAVEAARSPPLFPYLEIFLSHSLRVQLPREVGVPAGLAFMEPSQESDVMLADSPA